MQAATPPTLSEDIRGLRFMQNAKDEDIGCMQSKEMALPNRKGQNRLWSQPEQW